MERDTRPLDVILVDLMKAEKQMRDAVLATGLATRATRAKLKRLQKEFDVRVQVMKNTIVTVRSDGDGLAGVVSAKAQPAN